MLMLMFVYFVYMMMFYFLLKWILKIVVDLGFLLVLVGGVLVWVNVGGVSGLIVISLLM